MTNPEVNLKKLVDLGMNITNITFSKVGNSYFANVYSDINSKIITSSVCTGFAEHPSEALNKALSEMVERSAFQEGYYSGHIVCQTERSDGFAAMPLDIDNYISVCDKVRDNALNEATERYVWAKWWDDRTSATIEKMSYDEIRSKFLGLPAIDLIDDLKKRCHIKFIYKINPRHNLENKYLTILIFELSNGGFISGGACDNDLNSSITRAISELYRHGLAWLKAQTQHIIPETFYEKRLIFFASGAGSDLVNETLKKSSKSTASVILPALKFNTLVPHRFSSLYLCHRCLYENQPPFIGGPLERFCI